MRIKKLILPLLFIPFLFASCIKDEAPNPEADILVFTFPKDYLRTKEVEIYNDFVVTYPRANVNLREAPFRIEVSEGAIWKRVEHTEESEILFYISVTSESGEYSKVYPIRQVENLPDLFTFDNWETPSKSYQYENPKEGSLQWYSSNNGAAIAWNSPGKTANEYLIRRYKYGDNTAVELRTMVGPGAIAGGINFIPCLSGSLYMGGFNALTGLTDPLRSTLFGVPYSNGRPVKLSGEYIFKEGTADYINSDGTTDKNKKDICAIYAILYKTDDDVQFLYGDNIATSPNLIARAEINPGDFVQQAEFIPFEIEFDYASYRTPFSWDELLNDEYKLAIVCASSNRGQHYEGCPGNTLIVDNLKVHYLLSDSE